MTYIKDTLRILIVMLLLPFFANSQTKSESVLQYNKLINSAQLRICNYNFKEADNPYVKAFLLNPDKPFSRDLFSAFHCAMDINDYENAEQYLKKLLSRGINEEFLDRVIVGYYKGEKLAFVQGMLKKYPNNNFERQDGMNKEMLSMYKKDQRVRAYFAERDANGNYMNDSVYTLDSINAGQLLQMLEIAGHTPNEDETGTAYNFPLASAYFDIIIFHGVQNYCIGKQENVFDTLVYKSIFSFDYAANKFATLYSQCAVQYQSAYFKYGSTTIQFPISIIVYTDLENNHKPYFEKLTSAEETRINAEREKLGLCTLADLRKKIYFTYVQKLNNGKYFAFNDGIIFYNDLTKAELPTKLCGANPIYEYEP